MDRDKVHEILSKVLGFWDEKVGVENCDSQKIWALYKVLSMSPHDDGFMRVSLTEDSKNTYLVPFEDIILFGLNGSEVNKYGRQKNH